MERLMHNKDFRYSFPYGHWAEPQIKVLSGEYEGLVFDIMASGVAHDGVNGTDTLGYTFKILKVWKNIPQEQFDGKNITITEKDKDYLDRLVFSFIATFNEKQARIK